MSNNIIIQAETMDEFITILENDPCFYRDWHALGQMLLPRLFNVVNVRKNGRSFNQVQYSYPCPALYFSEDHRYDTLFMGVMELVQTHKQRLQLQKPPCTDYFPNYDAERYFSIKLTEWIQAGEIKLQDAQAHALATLHSCNNVAKTCRDTGMTRGAVKKLAEQYPADLYQRYMAVQQGQRYFAVMGDCEGFICDHPVFDPELLIRDEDTADIEPGDLVCKVGSSTWFEVEHALSGCVRTSIENGERFEHNYISKPFYLVKKQYVALANRFCHTINNMTVAQFLSQRATAQ